MRELNKVLEVSDVVIEVLDARDPLGTRSKEAEKKVNGQLSAVTGKPKRVILLLNKIGMLCAHAFAVARILCCCATSALWRACAFRTALNSPSAQRQCGVWSNAFRFLAIVPARPAVHAGHNASRALVRRL